MVMNFRIPYEECVVVWTRSRKQDFIGELEHISYAAKKMKVSIRRHPELAIHYRRYRDEYLK